MRPTQFKRTKIILFLMLPFCAFCLSACGSLVKTASRPELGMDADQDSYERNYVRADDLDQINRGESKISADLEKYAYELGLDPKKNLTDSEKAEIKRRRLLRTLERDLDTDKEKFHYSKLLPLFKNDAEKVEYLSIKSSEGRQAWANRHKIYDRECKASDFQNLIERQDIALGMSQDIVKRSWGEPTTIDISGNPVYKNERWKYVREMPTVNGYKRERRYVYFEGGKVVGWETE